MTTGASSTVEGPFDAEVLTLATPVSWSRFASTCTRTCSVEVAVLVAEAESAASADKLWAQSSTALKTDSMGLVID
ncbi:hypothetical protein AUC60_23185 [Pseudomonas caspiana]|uniref:Uncharacterized protein n=1 Tax=Pseudomonas caspiana TaxID=1451454 RepID=A0A1Y3NV66_9PSED|nr:hypothetical protein AUC60_23185 [Pseudomonas caspiana]